MPQGRRRHNKELRENPPEVLRLQDAIDLAVDHLTTHLRRCESVMTPDQIDYYQRSIVLLQLQGWPSVENAGGAK